MDPENDLFWWGNFMRSAGLDKFTEKRVIYPTAKYFNKDGDLNHEMSWLLAKNRKHKMFIRKCGDVIGHYETCIENKYWRLNIDNYIDEDLRKKCYLPWIQIRRCSQKFIGEEFTTFLEVGREINFAQKMQADRERQEYHEMLHNYKLQLFGPDHIIPTADDEESEGEEEAAEEEE